MEKQDFFKCIEIHKRLKEKVKAGIFIGINGKTMSISITGFRGVRFITYLDDISGWLDYDKIVEDILYKYEDFLLEKFFTKGGLMKCLLR